MEPAAVALDIQALQDRSGAEPARRRQVTDLARVLHRAGRLAAALVAPELPALDPGVLPELFQGGLIRWDTRAVARELLQRHPGLVHYVPAPLLHSGPGDPGGMIVSRHWADSAVPRIVGLEADDVARLTGTRTDRLDARREWIRASAAIAVNVADIAAAAGSLGVGATRCVPASAAGHEVEAVIEAFGAPGRAGPEPPGAVPYRLAVVGPFPPGGGGIGAYNARFVRAVAASGRALVDAVTVSGMGWEPPTGVDLIHAESFGTDIRPASYDWVIYTLGNSDGHLATIEAALRHPGWLWLHEARLPAVATTALAPLDDDRFAGHMARLLERAYPSRPPLAAARAAGRSHLALAAAGVGLTAPLVERAAGVLVNSTAALHALDLDLPPLAWRPPTAVLPPACPPPAAAPAAQAAPAPHAAAPAPQAAAPQAAASQAARPRHDDQVIALGVVSMGKRPDLLVDAAAIAGCRLAFVGPCPDILGQVIGDRAAARGISDRVQVTGRLDDDAYREWLGRAALAVQLRDSAGGEMSAAVLDALAAGLPVLTSLASAADYPPGTVELLGNETTAAPLAAAIARLLGPAGAARRAELSAAGRRFAETHRMEHLAATVIGVLQGAGH